MTRGYGGYGARMFRKGMERRPPTFPDPSEIEELPLYKRPKTAGKGRYSHWTERGKQIRGEVRKFTVEVLGFKKPYVYTNFKLTGNVDIVVVDKSKRSEPCARFEVKSAKEKIVDIHAKKRKRARKRPRRAGRFEIDPMQHAQSGAGHCGLFYVLVPVKGKRTIQHVGICTLPMIEKIIERPIKARRPVHREAAYECPTVRQWIRWKRG